MGSIEEEMVKISVEAIKDNFRFLAMSFSKIYFRALMHPMTEFMNSKLFANIYIYMLTLGCLFSSFAHDLYRKYLGCTDFVILQ